MRTPFLQRLRQPVSALTAFASPFLRPRTSATTTGADLRRAGADDARLLSPRECRDAGIRLSRTYW